MSKISKQVLQSLGLTEIQGAVYLAALELGEANMQELSRKSGVKRTSIYNFIDELKGQGLLVETKKRKRKVYSAIKPDHLLDLGRMRLSELEKVLPELSAIANQSRKQPRVTFYEGIDGIKEVYADTLKDRKPVIAWSDWEHMKTALGSFYDEYPKERAQRGITFKTIARDTLTARESSKKDIGQLREQKFITSGDLKTEINIYGDKVALMSFRTRPPFVVLIEDHDIAETLRTAWSELWERL